MGGAPAPSELANLPVGQIAANPRQPRRKVDAESLGALAESVRAQGLIQPVVVRPLGEGSYELIAGERRWRAARAAGLATVPALIRETDDRESLILALVENVAREDLTPIEEARAYALLQDEFALTLGDLSERVGRSKPSVSNRLRLLELSDDVLDLVERGALTEGHARAVLVRSRGRRTAGAGAEDRPRGDVRSRRGARRALGRRPDEAAPFLARRPRARLPRAHCARAPDRSPGQGRRPPDRDLVRDGDRARRDR